MKRPSGDSRPHNSVWITPEDFEYICFNTARELLTHNEPIPDYTTRDNALLESALGSPRQTFDGKLLYPTLVEQAIVLFYSLIKNHPFQNGNKRIAVMTLLIFLALNKKWLGVDEKGLYKLAQLVSESEPKDREGVIKLTKKLLNEFIIDFLDKK